MRRIDRMEREEKKIRHRQRHGHRHGGKENLAFSLFLFRACASACARARSGFFMRRFLGTALIAFLCFAASLLGKDPEFLFVLFDAGETNALLPVIEKVQQEKREFKIWTAGTATELLRKKPELATKCQEIDSKIDKSWPREKPIDLELLSKLCTQCASQKVITGVASQIQAQILQAYQGKAATFAYWDNFSPQGAGSYFTQAHKVQKLAEKLLVPSRDVAADFSSEKVLVVGQPTLEQWTRELALINEASLKEKYKLKEELITYIGGYGPEYEKAAKLFVRCVKESGFSGQVIMQIHPKSDGAFEREICKGEAFLFLPLSTLEAVKLANSVVTYNSTVGFQALFAKKRVLFVIPEEDPFTNLAIEKGFAPKISSPKTFLPALKAPQQNSDIASTMGVPENSAQLIFDEISR